MEFLNLKLESAKVTTGL